MKLRAIIFILVVAVLSGCTNGGKDENNVILEKVVQAIHDEGPELIALTENGVSDSDALNGVHPYHFTIGDANIKVSYPHRIYIYIFDSEQARKKGQTEISGKFVVTTLTAIKTYTQKNVLVVYFATDGKLDKFDDKIQTAMQKL